MTTTRAWSGRRSDGLVKRDVVSRHEDHLALSDLRAEPVNSMAPSSTRQGNKDKNKKKTHRPSSRKPGEESIVQIDPDEDLSDYSNEYRIKQRLLRNYDKTTRPVRNDTTPTTLYVGMSLFHILDTNEKFQTLSALIAIRLRWIDEYLRWNASDYEGLEDIWIPAIHIWTPDIFINNFADDSFQDFMNTFAIVSSSGQVLWMFPAVVKTYCTLDVQHFPFDDQKCNVVFISWTFHGHKLNVTYNVSEHQAIYYTPKNQEWYVDKVTVQRQEKVYACCSEPYPDVTFTIHMTRRSLFYIINLIFPCLLIYAVSFLGFFLPVESGEKVNLEITILLALVVFLLIVGETLPPTPDAIPVLGILFSLTMLMVSVALVMAVIVTNIFLRKDSGKRVPSSVRRVFLHRRHRPRSRSTHRAESLMTSSAAAPAIIAPTTTSMHGPGRNHHDTASAGVRYRDTFDLDSLSILSELDQQNNTTGVVVRQNSRRSYTSSTRRCSPSVVTSSRRSRTTSMQHTADTLTTDANELYSREWQMLAKVVDRIFFWLFVFSSIGALGSMFASLPHKNLS